MVIVIVILLVYMYNRNNEYWIVREGITDSLYIDEIPKDHCQIYPINSYTNIFFFWEGSISDKRLKILKDCIYSTRYFNKSRPIYLVSNSLKDSQFEPKFNIKILKYDNSFFNDLDIPISKVEKYKQSNPRDFSDLFRLVLLYKFGGSYIDTDDLCINQIKDTPKNIICRSYDAHTSFYNKIQPIDCMPGKYREITGYDEINTFPRNDCLMNFEPGSNFLKQVLSHRDFKDNDNVINITDNVSWQSIILDVCKANVIHIGSMYNYKLTLLYLFEDFVAHSSEFDKCLHGGEMCDVYKNLKNIDEYPWGEYKCDIKTALEFLKNVLNKYSNLSHLWLHSKDDNKEWMLDKLNLDKDYSISTWIYYSIKQQIY